MGENTDGQLFFHFSQFENREMGKNCEAIIVKCIGVFIAADAKPEGGDAAGLDCLMLCSFGVVHSLIIIRQVLVLILSI